MINRRFAIASLVSAASLAVHPLLHADDRVFLAAHRGGVVDEAHPENSIASVQAAISRNYWMIEVDVRATRDGEPILHHDSTFDRYFGDARRPEDMTWAEVRQLRSTPGNRAPLHFDEMCALVEGKLS